MHHGTKAVSRRRIIVLIIILHLIGLTYLGLINPNYERIFPKDVIYSFSTVFLSIILETIPFILLGSLISSLIQIYVSEQAIARIIPKNRFIGIIAAAFMGLIFPVCECAIIPIARRLIKKGVPTGIAVTFMLAVPIVNPIVLLSTYYAFYNKPEMVLLRGGFGLITAIAIGIVIQWLQGNVSPMKNTAYFNGHYDHDGECSHHYHDHDHDNGHEGHHHSHEGHHKGAQKLKILRVLDHTSHEFYDIGKYLILGAIISASFQTFISRGHVLALGMDSSISILVMMTLAFIISLCSEADAFVARSFMGQFTTGSIAAFLIFGPMLDIKNTLMLNGTFKKGFTLKLIIIIFIICFIDGLIINSLGI